ncbi:MAG: thiol:disulfide interchange protein DsbA/DsbL [Burkholderiaceae bacterium]|nr:thiol:disulfide interchange protein DsbA/DsbL [Burkholderiaceae bacterium]
MRLILRHLLAPVLIALALAACSQSSDKPAAPPASASQPAAAVAPPASADQQAPNAGAAPASSGESGNGQYITLKTAQPTNANGKIEVLEFFGYFCNHCYALDPKLTAWAHKQGNRIVFKRIPVRPDEAKLYYALEAMGKLEALHDQIFNAVQVEHKRLGSESAAADFVEQHGVDRKNFIEHYNSFSVQSSGMNAASLAKAYGIDGVPMIAIDGRFITSASHAATRPGTVQNETGMHLSMLAVMDELVTKARQEHGLGAKSSGK